MTSRLTRLFIKSKVIHILWELNFISMLLLFLFRLTGVAASRMSEYTLLNGINLTSGFERYSNLVLRVLFLEPGNKIHLQRVSWSRTMSSFYGNSSHCHAALNTHPFGVTKRPKYAELNVEFFRLFFSSEKV